MAKKYIVTLVRISEARVPITMIASTESEEDAIDAAVQGIDPSELSWSTPTQFEVKDFSRIPTKAEERKAAKKAADDIKQDAKPNWVWRCRHNNHASNWKDSESCNAGSKRPSTKASAIRSAEAHESRAWHDSDDYDLRQVDKRTWR